MPDGLLDAARTRLLRAALDGYTTDSVTAAIGLTGQAALQRRDVAGAARALRGRADPLATLVRLFVLGEAADARAVAAALHPLPLDDALAAGLLRRDSAYLRAAVDVRPYGESGPGTGVGVAPGTVSGALAGAARPGTDWWVVSDLGSDVRLEPLREDHVLGVGSASLTLAQAVPRDRVGRALDVGTGCGVQALHLSEHAEHVVATDVSERALRFAAMTAALSGRSWSLRRGSLFDPVAGERFDLIVANPPFVVSGGGDGWTYRDSGLAGDAVTERLVRGAPEHLLEDGSAHLLANWIVPADGDWQARVGDWFTPGGCDAWVWQREVAEPGEYVALWLRDAGLSPGTPQWRRRYDDWLDWFAEHDVVAVGMGLVSLWRTDQDDPAISLEDVPQALAQPIAAELPAWLRRQRWLRSAGDLALLDTPLHAAPGLVHEHADVLDAGGWTAGVQRLRQSHGLRWTVDTDDAVAALVAGCDGRTVLGRAVDVLAAAVGRPEPEVRAAIVPVVRDLVARGFLLPPTDAGRAR